MKWKHIPQDSVIIIKTDNYNDNDLQTNLFFLINIKEFYVTFGLHIADLSCNCVILSTNEGDRINCSVIRSWTPQGISGTWFMWNGNSISSVVTDETIGNDD
jgi:hypothetical protein